MKEENKDKPTESKGESRGKSKGESVRRSGGRRCHGVETWIDWVQRALRLTDRCGGLWSLFGAAHGAGAVHHHEHMEGMRKGECATTSGEGKAVE